MSSIFLGEYYSTQYGVRLYPLFGYSIIYIRIIILLGSTTKKTLPRCDRYRSKIVLLVVSGISNKGIQSYRIPQKHFPSFPVIIPIYAVLYILVSVFSIIPTLPAYSLIPF